MKRTFIYTAALVLFLFAFAACGSGDYASVPIQLEGPVLKSTGPEGNLEFTGALANLGYDDARYVEITFLLYDQNGRAVDTASGFVSGAEGDNDPSSNLSPGQSAFFTVLSHVKPGEVQSVSYRIGYNEEISPELILE